MVRQEPPDVLQVHEAGAVRVDHAEGPAQLLHLLHPRPRPVVVPLEAADVVLELQHTILCAHFARGFTRCRLSFQ